MTSKTVEIHNPSYAEVPPSSLKRIPLPKVSEKSALRVAMISNQKPNANELLQLVAAGLQATRHGYRVDPKVYRKTDEAHPATREAIREISLRADLAIVAIGD